MNSTAVELPRVEQSDARIRRPTFVKALDGVVGQGHQELCSSSEAECQRSAGLSRLLYQTEPANERSGEKPRTTCDIEG